MSDNIVPMFRFSSDTGEVEVLGEGSKFASAHRETTTTDAPVSGIAPESGLNAAERRLAYLVEQTEQHTFRSDGTKVYAMEESRRQAFLKEVAHLREVTIPYQRQKAAEITEQYEANRVERGARLVQESALRDEVERRAAEKALDAAASNRAKQIADDLHLR